MRHTYDAITRWIMADKRRADRCYWIMSGVTVTLGLLSQLVDPLVLWLPLALAAVVSLASAWGIFIIQLTHRK